MSELRNLPALAHRLRSDEGGSRLWLWALISGLGAFLQMLMAILPMLLGVGAIVLVIMMLLQVPILGRLFGFAGSMTCDVVASRYGIAEQDCKALLDLVEKSGVGDIARNTFDCANADQSEPDWEDYCDPNALKLAEDSPIPPDKAWLIPIFQRAAEQFDVPWELLAAETAVRTNFGDDSQCVKTESNGKLAREGVVGGGFLRFTREEWIAYGFDAGDVREWRYVDTKGREHTGYLEDRDGPFAAKGDDGLMREKAAPPAEAWGKITFTKDGDCASYQMKNAKALKVEYVSEAQLKKNMADKIDKDDGVQGGGGQEFGDGTWDEAGGRERVDARDPVDAIFTMARLLAAHGAKGQPFWSYSGGPPGSCAPSEKYFDPIYPLNGPGAVDIPAGIVALARQYEFAVWTRPTFPPAPGEVEGENTQTPIPKRAENRIISAVGEALGVKPETMEIVRPYLHEMIRGESGYRPAIWQTVKDQNSAYPDRARGLFQFIPPTFQTWKVGGYDNIFNPLDNTLAAMNAMHNASSMLTSPEDKDWYHPPGRAKGFWPRNSGWSPGGSNPYAGESKPELSGPYSGTPLQYEVDKISEAVAEKTGKGYYSPCYTAHVHAWYEAILKSTFGGSGSTINGDVAQRITQVAKLQLGLTYFYNQMNPRSQEQMTALGPRRNTEEIGFSGHWDCSTFTSYALWVGAGFWMTPHTDAQWRLADPSIAQTAAENNVAIRGPRGTPPGGWQTGDLILYKEGKGGVTGHVALVLTKTEQIEAGNPVHTGPVRTSGMYGWVRVKKLSQASGGGGGDGALPAGLGQALQEIGVRQHPIEFGAARKREMAAYSKRHYGDRTATLNPSRIVLHFTAGNGNPWGAFNSDQAVSGGGAAPEKPNVCSHFVVLKDGSVEQFVPTNIRCRHTIGLNDSAIGIEIVEPSSANNILARPAQLRGVLKLVRVLQRFYSIDKNGVIGHGTANDDPNFHDKTGIRNDHSDWNADQVRRFRARL